MYETLKRAILRGNYASKNRISEQISILYAHHDLTDEQYMELMEMLMEGGE